MLAVTVNFTMWDNMIKDRIWFVFMKHLGSSKRSYRAEWRARGPLCHLRWYHNSTIPSDCFRSFTIHRLPIISWSEVISVHIFWNASHPPLRSEIVETPESVAWLMFPGDTAQSLCHVKEYGDQPIWASCSSCRLWFKIVWGLAASYQSYCQFTAESGSG